KQKCHTRPAVVTTAPPPPSPVATSVVPAVARTTADTPTAPAAPLAKPGWGDQLTLTYPTALVGSQVSAGLRTINVFPARWYFTSRTGATAYGREIGAFGGYQASGSIPTLVVTNVAVDDAGLVALLAMTVPSEKLVIRMWDEQPCEI